MGFEQCSQFDPPGGDMGLIERYCGVDCGVIPKCPNPPNILTYLMSRQEAAIE